MTYKIRAFEHIADVPQKDWEACVADSIHLSHQFLSLVSATVNLRALGIAPRYLLLYRDDGQVAGCLPVTFKWGTRREFGCEYAWLKAAEQNGLKVWPKVQSDMLLYPVPASKPYVASGLKEQQREVVTELLEALFKIAAHRGLSVVNLMYLPEKSALPSMKHFCLLSKESVSVWDNAGWSGYEDYVSSLQRNKRYELKKQYKRLEQEGIKLGVAAGDQFPSHFWPDFYRGFTEVNRHYGSVDHLPLDFFVACAKQLSKQTYLFYAYKDGCFLAAAFALRDKQGLYVHHWSCLDSRTTLAFPLICYEPIKFALENGIPHVNAGPALEYKRLRGFKSADLEHRHYFINSALEGFVRKYTARGSKQGSGRP